MSRPSKEKDKKKIQVYKFFKPEIISFFGGKREMEKSFEKWAETESGIKNYD